MKVPPHALAATLIVTTNGIFMPAILERFRAMPCPRASSGPGTGGRESLNFIAYSSESCASLCQHIGLFARAATWAHGAFLRAAPSALTVVPAATIHEQPAAGFDRCRGMGLVMVKIKLINFEDVRNVERGLLAEGAVRATEIEALVDTGAVELAIPEDVVDVLGVPVIRHNRYTVADGRAVILPIAGMVAVEVLGRRVTGEAIVLPRGARALLGAVQLELMDLVVVPRTGEVVTNPEHPDGPLLALPGLTG
jgi:clan AA aspartic protease